MKLNEMPIAQLDRLSVDPSLWSQQEQLKEVDRLLSELYSEATAPISQQFAEPFLIFETFNKPIDLADVEDSRMNMYENFPATLALFNRVKDWRNTTTDNIDEILEQRQIQRVKDSVPEITPKENDSPDHKTRYLHFLKRPVQEHLVHIGKLMGSKEWLPEESARLTATELELKSVLEEITTLGETVHNTDETAPTVITAMEDLQKCSRLACGAADHLIEELHELPLEVKRLLTQKRQMLESQLLEQLNLKILEKLPTVTLMSLENNLLSDSLNSEPLINQIRAISEAKIDATNSAREVPQEEERSVPVISPGAPAPDTPNLALPQILDTHVGRESRMFVSSN